MNVVDEFTLAGACLMYVRRAYADAEVVLLANCSDDAVFDRWRKIAGPRTRVTRTPKNLYALEHGGAIVLAHLSECLAGDGAWWFKIDPDTFVRRPLAVFDFPCGFFGTVQTLDPRPVLQGGCIGGDRVAVQRLLDSRALEAPELLDYDRTWAAGNPIVLERARSGLVSFDFVHAWACERAGIPIVDHPDIKSNWLAPPRLGWRYAVTHPHKNLDTLDPVGPDPVNPAAEDIRRILQGVVPADAVVAVVSRGDESLLELESGEGWHFPRHRTGSYLGHHPADSDDAIRHLDAVRQSGARFLVIPEPSLWWLEHYDGFAAHLSRFFRRVAAEPSTCVVYDLTASPAADQASAV